MPGGNFKKKTLSNTSIIINEQTSVIFLLRAVLRLNADFLGSMLQSTGSNPSCWDLKLCRSCYRVVEEADFVFTRLEKLHVEFDKLSKAICSKVIVSIKSKPNLHAQDGHEIEIKPIKRRPGRPKRHKSRFTKIKTKRDANEKSIDLGKVTEEDEISVAFQIRKEIALQADKGQGVAFVDKFGFSFQMKEIDIQTVSSFKVLQPPPSNSLNTLKNESRRNLRVRFADENEAAATDNLTSISDAQVSANKESTMEDVNDDDYDYIENDYPLEVDHHNSDNDFDPGPSQGFIGEDGKEVVEDEDDPMPDDSADSDFEPHHRRRSSRRRVKKRKDVTNKDRGIIMKAVKMENAQTYCCPQCQEVFENASLCDEHILSKHYGGKWPQSFSCHLCEDISFKGEYWLRNHYKLWHPGIKLHVDETMERSIDEGTMQELSYKVIPVGQTITSADEPNGHQFNDEPDSEFVNCTVTEPPPNTFNIPVAQAGGIRYLVLPNVMKRLPDDVLSLIQHGKEGKPCERCKKHFPTELQLQAHVRRAHDGENLSYCCPLCPKRFERIGKLLIGHIQKTHILSRFTCEKCGNTFKEDILLQAHVQRNHFGVDNPYKCIKCGLRYPRRAALNKHLKRVHMVQIASYALLSKPKKRPGTAAKNIVRRSKKRVKLEKKFPCEICTKKGQLEMKFVSEEQLDVHIKRRHMGIARPYPCSICEKRYSSPAKVENHMKIHIVRNDVSVDDEPSPLTRLPFVCAPCNKQFKTQSMYNAHLKGRFHQNIRPFVCEICSQGFRDLKYLQNHQSQKHHIELNINPNKCRFCHKVLASARTLDDHIRMRHTKNAKFKCPHCDVQFQHKSARDHHINALHTKSQHFLCTQCPRTFLKDFYLKSHILRVHSGEKPYECKFCLRRFADKSTYNRHVEEHSGKIHSCPDCGKSGFKTRHSLRVHRKTFHKELLDEEDERKKIIVPEATDLPQPQDVQVSKDKPIAETTEESCASIPDLNNVSPQENDAQNFNALKSEIIVDPLDLFL